MSGSSLVSPAVGAVATSRATSAAPRVDSPAKTFATLRAELALQGFALVQSSDDRGRPTFVVSRWAMTRQLNSIEEVQAFARQVGGRAA